MKRYYNSLDSINVVPIGDRSVRIINDLLISEMLISTGVKHTFELDYEESTGVISNIDVDVLPTTVRNRIALNTNGLDVPILARIIGLYYKNKKLKNDRKKRRIMVKGRLVSVGTNLGVIPRMFILRRKQKRIMTRYERKRSLIREIGKLYSVIKSCKTKKITYYKPV